jgi:hypothetical protein
MAMMFSRAVRVVGNQKKEIQIATAFLNYTEVPISNPPVIPNPLGISKRCHLERAMQGVAFLRRFY